METVEVMQFMTNVVYVMEMVLLGEHVIVMEIQKIVMEFVMVVQL